MKKLLLTILSGIAAVGITGRAVADISVSLDPSSQSINVGGLASVDLVISGLGNNAFPSLGAFNFDLTYDPTILSGMSLAFGNDLNLGISGSNQSSDLNTPGAIHLDEVSFESSADLHGAQPSSFTLATLTFKGIGVGLSPIGFDLGGSLSDDLGQSLSFTTTPGQIQVDRSGPAPDGGATVGLLLLGLVALQWFRGKQRETAR